MLDALKRIAGMGDLVFSMTGVTPVSGFSKAKTRLDALSGISNWRLHDLRRTAVTAMADLGVDATVADRVLNDVGAGTMGTVKRVYERSELLDHRRARSREWSEYVIKAAIAPARARQGLTYSTGDAANFKEATMPSHPQNLCGSISISSELLHDRKWDDACRPTS